MMNFTPEQAAAITEDAHNLVVTAGAGSGKTRVLVERYIHLLEQPDWAVPDIVAITFTEKAAREMRDRVRAAIAARLATAPDDASRAHWAQHQQRLESARIGTVHRLCAALLRANPAQVPLDPAFEVLDENEAYMLRLDAVEQTLLDLIEGDSARLLSAYGTNAVRAALRAFTQTSSAENLLRAIPESAADLLAAWAALRADLHAEWVAVLQADAALNAALDYTPPPGVDPDDKLYAQWQDLHAARPAQDDGDPAAFLAWCDAHIKLNVGSGKKWGGKEALVEAKAVLSTIREAARAALKTYPPPLDEIDEEAAKWLLLWRVAVARARDHYRTLKTERAAVDYDDLEALTADLLTEHPEVAARYAAGEFRHIMVDEFQDTNARQRDIILALCGAAPGRLFVVGDPKQSIYAFRGADVSVFGAVRAGILAAEGREILLNRSFRAHANLMECFNHLFAQTLQVGPGALGAYEVDYGPGMVAHRATPDDVAFTTPLQIILPQKVDDLDAADKRRWEAFELARLIRRMVDAEAPVWDKTQGDYRPLRYGDIALLFRALTDSPLYEEVFKAQGIPYLTVAGKGYYDRQEVWDVLNALRALHNPLDDLALASVLRSPMVGLSDEALFALRLSRDENGARRGLWDALAFAYADGGLAIELHENDAHALKFAHESLHRLRGMAGRVPIGELLEALLDETAYDAILSGLPDGDRRRGNLDKLLEKARASGRVVLGAFMRYIEDLTAIEPREGEAPLAESGAVQLLSIHKSKGLEFPLVIIADAARRPRNAAKAALGLDPDYGAACRVPVPDDDPAEPFIYWAAEQAAARREAAERARLLYVAGTRAADYLVISGAEQSCENWLRT
ncbi:MAG: UvrD-helicase domain-containing protein, partial [Anaerolineales bacterium]